jgi:hypothetical protein
MNYLTVEGTYETKRSSQDLIHELRILRQVLYQSQKLNLPVFLSEYISDATLYEISSLVHTLQYEMNELFCM